MFAFIVLWDVGVCWNYIKKNYGCLKKNTMKKFVTRAMLKHPVGGGLENRGWLARPAYPAGGWVGWAGLGWAGLENIMIGRKTPS